MRLFATTTLALLLLSTGIVAQDKPAAPADDALILLEYLGSTDKAEREKLRQTMTKWDVKRLQEAIDARPFPKQATGQRKFETFCPDEFKRPYWLDVPENYDPAKPTPLLVCLHGGVFRAPVDSGVGLMQTWRMHAKNYFNGPMLILAASADCYNTTKNAAWWRDAGRDNIAHFVREAKGRFNVDDDRVFVTGFSDGGSGTFSLAVRSPDLFAGFFPMMGDPLIPTTDEVPHYFTNLKGLNIRACNGDIDPVYPGEELLKLYKQAKKYCPDLMFSNYIGRGHEYPPDVEFKACFECMKTWKRGRGSSKLDLSSDGTKYGQRDWLRIDGTSEMPKKLNKGDKPTAQGGGVFRIDLGVKIAFNAPPMGPAKIGRIDPESPADEMGLKPDDVIIAIDETAVAGFHDIKMALSKKKAGAEIEVTVKRGAASKVFSGKLNDRRKWVNGRVRGSLKSGNISLNTYNVEKVTVFLTATMLGKKGKLRVTVNRKKAFDEVVVPNTALLLDEFERTLDRTVGIIGVIQIDIQEVMEQ